MENIDPIECPACVDGWIAHDMHCPECDGTGYVAEDPFYVGADLLYDQMRDDRLTEGEYETS